MRKFFSVWLILLVVIAFAAALTVSYPVLTNTAQQAAKDDLSVLLDAAFMRISLAEASAKTVAESSNANILSKARAIDRFVSHDDGLLQTDALVVLCELLNVSAIDVTDGGGTIIASSVEGRVGRSLTEDNKTSWTTEALEGENLSLTRVDATNAALLFGCVSRTDAEGLIYIQSLDVPVMEAATAASPEQVLLDMSFIRDTIAVSGVHDDDKAFIADDAYHVRRTENDVTLVASRPLSQVYTVRSAVLFVEAAGFLLCLIFAIIIQLMLIKKRLSSRKAEESPPDAEEAALLPPVGEEAGASAAAEPPFDTEAYDAETRGEEPDDTEAMDQAAEDTPAEAAVGKGKRRKPRQKIFEFVEIVEDETTDGEAPVEDSYTPVETEAPVKRPRRGRRGKLAPHAPTPEETKLEQEAAIVFSQPEAVIEEPETPEPRKRRKERAKPDREGKAVPVKKAPPKRRGRQAPPEDADGAFDKIFD